jgi:aspartate/methionine/tyrosine aminotransferase
LPLHSLNPLVRDLGSPPIPEAQGWTRAYEGGCGPLIDLSQAVPADPPPPALLDRLAAATASPEAARYGPILGDDGLRRALAADVSALYGAEVGAEQVAITAGCNMGFIVAALLVAQAGEAVLLPTPWYFNHEMSLAMLGIEARPLPCRPEQGFIPDPDEAAALIDGRVRALVLVTPNNPTGAVYPPETIARFGSLCRERGVTLIIDETYRDFRPPVSGAPHGLLAAGPDHVIQLYSFSKAYCIPGHRTGAVLASPALIEGVGKILDNLQICAPRLAQLALPEVIPALAAWRGANAAAMAERAEAFRAALRAAPGWRLDSIGAYFAYLAHPFAGRPARAVAEALARERGVVALPGSFFGPGQEGHLRLAFANVGPKIIAGLGERLAGLSEAALRA